MVAPIDASWADTSISDSNLNQTTYGQGTADPATPSQFTTRPYWRTDRKRWEYYNGSSMVPFIHQPTDVVTTLSNINVDEKGGLFIMNFDSQLYLCHKHWRPVLLTTKNVIDRMGQYVDQTDFDNNYPTTDTVDIRGDPTNNRINFNINAADTTAQLCYKDYFAAIASDTVWTLRFKLVITTVTQGNSTSLTALIGMGSASAIGSEDFIGIRFRVDSTNKTINLMDTDAADPTSGVIDTALVHNIAVETLYVQIKRTTSTAYTVQLFSDAEYSTSVEGPTSAVALVSTVQNLRYLQIQTRSGGAGATSALIGYITDIEFYDGTTTPQR